MPSRKAALASKPQAKSNSKASGESEDSDGLQLGVKTDEDKMVSRLAECRVNVLCFRTQAPTNSKRSRHLGMSASLLWLTISDMLFRTKRGAKSERSAETAKSRQQLITSGAKKQKRKAEDKEDRKEAAKKQKKHESSSSSSLSDPIDETPREPSTSLHNHSHSHSHEKPSVQSQSHSSTSTTAQTLIQTPARIRGRWRADRGTPSDSAKAVSSVASAIESMQIEETHNKSQPHSTEKAERAEKAENVEKKAATQQNQQVLQLIQGMLVVSASINTIVGRQKKELNALIDKQAGYQQLLDQPAINVGQSVDEMKNLQEERANAIVDITLLEDNPFWSEHKQEGVVQTFLH